MRRGARYADIFEEGTDAYESTHIDPAGLDVVWDILKRLRKGKKGFIGPQFAWFDAVCPSYDVALTHDPLQAKKDDQLRQAAQRTKEMLLPAVNALKEVLSVVQQQVDRCDILIDAYKARRGFFVLPDEILSNILEFAALRSTHRHKDSYDHEEEYAGYHRTRAPREEEDHDVTVVKAAVKISHICRRFRRLLIQSSLVWSRVTSKMKNAMMMSTCLERCKRPIAEVTLDAPLISYAMFAFLYDNGGSQHRQQLVTTALQHREKWQTFHLLGDSGNRADFDDVEKQEVLEEYSLLSKELHFPYLSELDVSYPRCALQLDARKKAKVWRSIHFYSSWSCPQLSRMTARNFIPIPFPGANTLSTLTIYVEYHWSDTDGLDAQALATFIAACLILQKLTIKMDFAQTVMAPQAPYLDHSAPSSSNVEELDLDFGESRSEPLKALFSAIRFPRARAMKLSFSAANSSEKDEEDERDRLYADIVYAIFPDASVFPTLSELELDARVWKMRKRDAVDPRKSCFVPFHALPNLRYLKLKAPFTDVLLDGPGGTATTTTFPPLRRLVIRDSCYVDQTWLAGIIRRVKEKGGLDDLYIVVERGCDKLIEKGFEGELSREDLLRILEEDG